jgi:hypothetical protein
MAEKTEKVVLCPSAKAEPGAMLIGVLGEDGRVAHLATKLKIDENFIASASQHGPLEQRFRFSAPCQECKCVNWKNQTCRVVEQVFELTLKPQTPTANELPPCSIRKDCRWWLQSGKDACAVCSLVVRDDNSGMKYDADMICF